MSERHPGWRSRTGVFVCGSALFFGAAIAASECLGSDSEVNSTQEPKSPEQKSLQVIDIPIVVDGRHDFAGGRWGEQAYKDNGVGFRRALKILENRQDLRFAEMQKLYLDIKESERGNEYLVNGEVFAPKTGDVFAIQDFFWGEKNGVFLRSDPNVDPRVAGDNTFLYDFMEVEITGEPVEAFDTIRNKRAIFFPVEVVRDVGEIITDIKAPVGSRGFVSSEWFGGKVINP